MRRVLRWLLVWGGPTLILLFTAFCGFLLWVVASEPGTRWALRTAAHRADDDRDTICALERCLLEALAIRT